MNMSNKNRWRLIAALPVLVSLGGMAAGLSGKSGDTFNISLSRENPNLISVKGDKITGLTNLGGTLLDQEKIGNGALTLLASGEKPFTLVLETKSGNSYLVNVTPRNGMGASYTIHGTEPVSLKNVIKWEKQTPYESLIVDINSAMANGKEPPNYTLINTKPTQVSWPGIPATLERTALYSGGNLSIERYTITNPLHYSLALRESDFEGGGVRSVMFLPKASSLVAGGRMEAIIVRDVRNEP